jgi:hypothetical protein
MTRETPATPVRDLVLRFAPQEQRDALAALLEIEHEVLSAARDGLDHAVAHARLAWWEEELQRLSRADARHPATRRLAAAAAAGGRSPPDLTDLIEVARIDLARVAFLERGELDQYLGLWAGSVFRPLALLGLGATDPRTAAAERYAVTAGPAVREIGLLAAVTVHARAGRVFVPLGDPPAPHEPWYRSPPRCGRLPPQCPQTAARRLPPPSPGQHSPRVMPDGRVRSCPMRWRTPAAIRCGVPSPPGTRRSRLPEAGYPAP